MFDNYDTSSYFHDQWNRQVQDLIPDMSHINTGFKELPQINNTLKAQSAKYDAAIQLIQEQLDEQKSKNDELTRKLDEAAKQRDELADQVRLLRDNVDKIESHTAYIRIFGKQIVLNTRQKILGVLGSGLLLNIIWWIISLILEKCSA